MKTTWLVLLLVVSSTLQAEDTACAPTKDASKDTVLNGRAMETFEAGVKPGETFHWTFGETKGEGQADAQGLVAARMREFREELGPLSMR